MPNAPYYSPQGVQQPFAVTPVSTPRLQPEPQARLSASNHRRGSVRSEGTSSNQPQRESPFKDSRGTVGIRSFHIQGYAIERDAMGNGKVSSYIKFQWPSTARREPPKPAQQPLDHYMNLFRGGDGRRSQLEIMGLHSAGENPTFSPTTTVGGTSSAFDVAPAAYYHQVGAAHDIELPWSGAMLLRDAYPASSDMPLPVTPLRHETAIQLSPSGSPIHRPLPTNQQLRGSQQEAVNMGPMLLPEQFGLQNKLDDYQRRFMNFCAW